MSLIIHFHNISGMEVMHLGTVDVDALEVSDGKGNHLSIFMHPKLAEAICEVFETLNSGECNECKTPFDIDDLAEGPDGQLYCGHCLEATRKAMQDDADGKGDHQLMRRQEDSL